ncbi:MAG: primosomal protein N' [Candidatus Omnitrophota bacterium]
MLFARVVLGLHVEGPFDYIVPEGLDKKIQVGMRVGVNFANRQMTGYVIGLTRKSKIKKLKAIEKLIDSVPVLDRHLLLLTKQVAEYYCSSWGEAIETALPDALRHGKKISVKEVAGEEGVKPEQRTLLLHDCDTQSRWASYIKYIREAGDSNQASLILVPDKSSLLAAERLIQATFNSSFSAIYRKKPKELNEWVKIKSGGAQIVIGMRSAIFAPLKNLGLIIIDQEQDFVYKQDQVPHYHAREVAYMRNKLNKGRLILGSSCPSLESFYKTTTGEAEYKFFPRKNGLVQIKTVDSNSAAVRFNKKKSFLPKYLEDSVYSSLSSGEKVLIFVDRKGFATAATCSNCNVILKCPRCNINLVYHYEDKLLSCHFCNFKSPLSDLCPVCNAGYIQFSGVGTEKAESELSRIFPTTRIRKIDDQDLDVTKEADLFLSTRMIIQHPVNKFDFIVAPFIDNSLNRIDFHASENTFYLLNGLLNLAKKKFLIQTAYPQHHCFQALLANDFQIFYNQELKQRKQLEFPPYKHLVMVKIRGKVEEKVRQKSEDLFKHLKVCKKDTSIKIISLNPGQVPKLRGNYYYQILLSSKDARKISRYLKSCLKDFPHSGIIITIDVDPI